MKAGTGMRRPWIVGALGMGGIVCASVPARGDQVHEQIKVLAAQAEQRHEAKDYAGELALLARIVELRPYPWVPCHQGIALKLLGQHEDALEKLRACRVMTQPRGDEATRLNQQILELETKLRPPPVAAPPPRDEAAERRQRELLEQKRVALQAEAARRERVARRRLAQDLGIGFGVAAAFGVGAAITGGLALNRQANLPIAPGAWSDSDHIAQDRATIESAYGNLRSLSIATDVLIGAAVVSGVVTVGVALARYRSERRAPRLVWTGPARSPSLFWLLALR